MKDIKYITHNENKLITIYPLDEICTMLKVKFDDLQKGNEYLKKELDKLKEKKWKDNKLQEMKKQLDKMEKDYWRGFPISEEEEKAINEWKVKHIIEKHNGNSYSGTIGGRFTYDFIPTSIGTFGSIKCTCGEEFTFQEP